MGLDWSPLTYKHRGSMEYGGDKSLKYSSTDCCKPGRGIEFNIFWRTLNTIFQLCDIFFWSDFRVLRMICHQTSVVYSINKYFHYKIFIIVHKFINITKDWKWEVSVLFLYDVTWNVSTRTYIFLPELTFFIRIKDVCLSL